MKVGGIERVFKLFAGYVETRRSTKEIFFLLVV